MQSVCNGVTSDLFNTLKQKNTLKIVKSKFSQVFNLEIFKSRKKFSRENK